MTTVHRQRLALNGAAPHVIASWGRCMVLAVAFLLSGLLYGSTSMASEYPYSEPLVTWLIEPVPIDATLVVLPVRIAESRFSYGKYVDRNITEQWQEAAPRNIAVIRYGRIMDALYDLARSQGHPSTARVEEHIGIVLRYVGATHVLSLEVVATDGDKETLAATLVTPAGTFWSEFTHQAGEDYATARQIVQWMTRYFDDLLEPHVREKLEKPFVPEWLRSYSDPEWVAIRGDGGHPRWPELILSEPEYTYFAGYLGFRMVNTRAELARRLLPELDVSDGHPSKRYLRWRMLAAVGEMDNSYHESGLILATHPGLDAFAGNLISGTSFNRGERGDFYLRTAERWHHRVGRAPLWDVIHAQVLLRAGWHSHTQILDDAEDTAEHRQLRRANAWKARELIEGVVTQMGPLPLFYEQRLDAYAQLQEHRAIPDLVREAKAQFPRHFATHRKGVMFSGRGWNRNDTAARQLVSEALQNQHDWRDAALLVASYVNGYDGSRGRAMRDFPDAADLPTAAYQWFLANPEWRELARLSARRHVALAPANGCCVVAFSYALMLQDEALMSEVALERSRILCRSAACYAIGLNAEDLLLPGLETSYRNGQFDRLREAAVHWLEHINTGAGAVARDPDTVNTVRRYAAIASTMMGRLEEAEKYWVLDDEPEEWRRRRLFAWAFSRHELDATRQDLLQLAENHSADVTIMAALALVKRHDGDLESAKRITDEIRLKTIGYRWIFLRDALELRVAGGDEAPEPSGPEDASGQ